MRLMFLALVVTLLGNLTLHAQTDEPMKVKFGRLDKGELELLPMAEDSAADAYVLYDRMELEVDISYDGKLILTQYLHRRVKLIRESSFDRADLELYYYNKTEKFSKLDAVVHLPNGGQVELKSRDFIKEKYNDDVNVIKWTFPNIEPGAVIEYRYVKISERITVPPRYTFQEDIPVRYTEFTSSIPEFFNYVNLGNAANYDVEKSEVETKVYGSTPRRVYKETYAYKDLAAYKRQPYVNNFQDYLPNVRYQLQSITYPNGRFEKVYSDWNQTSEEMDDWPSFGKAFNNGGMSNGIWKEAEMKIAGLDTEREKAGALYDFVTTRIKWNGNYDWTSDRSPDKVFEEGVGDSGEMSLMLLALLKRAGIKADPLLVSLRGRGAPIQVYPIMNQFNHVMVVAQLDGEEVMMDPNDQTRPMGLPRAQALNHSGMVMEKGNPHWMDINVPIAGQTIVADMKFDAEGMAEVGIQSRMESYYAFTSREQLKSMEEEEEFPLIDKIIEKYPEAEIVSKEIKDAERKSGKLDLTMNLKVQAGQAIDDYLYIQPILIKMLDSELADAKVRLYPVDFPYPTMERYISKITIPEGYVVDELPESIRIRSEDGSVSCMFTAASSENNEVSVNLKVSIDRTVFQAQEYDVLRQIFKKIIDLQETTLVLKKAK